MFWALLPILAASSFSVGAEEAVEFVAPSVTEAGGNADLEDDEVVGEVMMLKEEVKFLQQELIEIIGKYETQKERDMQLSKDLVRKLAGLDKGTDGDLSAPESALKIVSDVSMMQTARTIRFCDSLSQKLKGFTIDELERYKLEQELKSLRRGAEKTLDCLRGRKGNAKVDRCDVLSVDDKLHVVVLAVGMNDGVKVGDTWFVDEDVTLKVVSVRSYVSAVMLAEGRISDVVPGMKARRNTIERTKK